jgi:hypothetical protein
VADVADRAQQFDRLHHRFEVVRRLAHAHEDDLAHGLEAARQRHLGDDLGAAQLALQPALPGHAEQTADRTAHLAADADTVARQQHAFDGLAILQRQQQPCRAVFCGVLRLQAQQAGELGPESRQRFAQLPRQEVLWLALASVQRQGLRPQAAAGAARAAARRPGRAAASAGH